MMEEEIKIVSIEDLLNNEELILLDNSFQEVSNWYRDGVFESRSFSDIDPAILRIVSESLVRRNELFSVKSVFSTPKVFEEISVFSEIISKKLRALNELEKDRRHYEGPNPYPDSNEDESKRLLGVISLQYSQIVRKRAKKIIHISDVSRYNALESITLWIDPRKKRLLRKLWGTTHTN